MPVRRFTLGDLPQIENARFTDAGLAAVSPAVVQRLKDLGLVGVYVTPDPTQFRVEEGRVVDTRQPGDTTLVLEVTTGQITGVRTIGQGERLDPDKNIDSPVHQRLRDHSPVKAGEPGKDLLRKDAIDDYTFRLNRHPGRRVDVAVSAPGDTPGAVLLDYMVTENRPWLLFGQVSNTGSESTDAWREHFGFIHNQLTNHDDILTLDYQTANFSDVHALAASYVRPFGDSERWRWQVGGSWYQYRAGDLGFQDADFKGDGWDVNARVIWNFFQQRELFLDAVAGVRFQQLSVENELAATEGDNQFLMPEVGLRLERVTDRRRTDASLMVAFNLADMGGTDEADLDALGRTSADQDFTILRLDASHAAYLDPYFQPKGSQLGLAHEIYLAARAQTSFGARLIPNEEDVAGGLYTVRGYPHAVVAGDNLVMGTVEYRFHLPQVLGVRTDPGTFFGKPFRWHPQYAYGPTDWDLLFRVFLDGARVTNADRLSFEADHSLAGTGVGVELALTRRFNVRADLGFALVELDDAAGGSFVDAGHTELHVVLTLVY